MSEENVEAFTRATAAFNHQDVNAVLKEVDPAVEWHGVLQALLGGEGTVYRGHEGVREWFRDMEDAFAEFDVEYSEIRDIGDRLVAIGRIRGRGRESGAEIESPLGGLIEFSDGKLMRVMSFLDPKEALQAAGLSE